MPATSYDIASLDASDAPAVAALQARAYTHAGEEARTAEFLQTIFSLREVAAFGVWAEGKLIGASCGIVLGAWGAVLDCVVDREERRQGIGSVLVGKITEWVLANAEFCILHVNSSASWELKWLALQGFQCVEPQLVLRKHLNHEGQKPPSDLGVLPWQEPPRFMDFGEALEQRGLGRFFKVSSNDVCCGAVFVEVAPRRRVISNTVAITFGNVARSLSGSALRGALAQAEELAREKQRTGIVVSLNSWYHRETDLLLRNKWGVVKTMYRLVNVAGLARYRQILSLPQIDLTHWAL